MAPLSNRRMHSRIPATPSAGSAKLPSAQMSRLLLFIVLMLALCVAPARAAMEVGMADDNVVVYNYFGSRSQALDQFVAMGGTHVRMNLQHERNSASQNKLGVDGARPAISYYDAAVEDIVAHGLEPQITLTWHHQSNPRRLAKWVYHLVEHFGGDVRRYSVFNEPDLLLDADCGARREARFSHRFASNLIPGKHGLRAQVLTRTNGMPLQLACSKYHRGRLYRRLMAYVVPAIHAGNPDAQVLAGETSAQPGLDWFVHGADPQHLGVDGWAHHGYQLRDLTPGRPTGVWGIGNLDLLRSIIKMPIYLTEFGYPHPHSSMDKRVFGHRLSQQQVANALTLAWKLAHRAGVKEMLQYQWFIKPRWRIEFWETALNNHPASRPTPAYTALKTLIRRWN